MRERDHICNAADSFLHRPHLFPSPFARPPTRPTPSRPSFDGNGGTPDDEMFLAAPPPQKEKRVSCGGSPDSSIDNLNDNVHRVNKIAPTN